MFVGECSDVAPEQLQTLVRGREFFGFDAPLIIGPCLLHDQIGRNLGAGGAGLNLLLDRRLDVGFCEVLRTDETRRLLRVTRPLGGLRGIKIDQIFLDETLLLGGQGLTVFVHHGTGDVGCGSDRRD